MQDARDSETLDRLLSEMYNHAHQQAEARADAGEDYEVLEQDIKVSMDNEAFKDCRYEWILRLIDESSDNDGMISKEDLFSCLDGGDVMSLLAAGF